MRIVFASIISVLLSIYALRNPGKVIIISTLAPLVSLPLVIILKSDLKYFNLGCSILAMFAAIVVYLRNQKQPIRFIQVILGFAGILLIYGLANSEQSVPLVVKILAVKFFIFPIILSVSATLGKDFIYKLIQMIFLVVTAGTIASLLEIATGANKLVSLGLQYGSNITTFQAGHLRAPGLALTNFDFSFICGLAMYLSIICRSNYFQFTKPFSKKNMNLMFVIGLIGIIISTTRSGFIFFLVCFATYSLLSTKNIGRIFSYVYGMGSTLILIYFNFSGFFTTTSLMERITLWRFLFSQYNLVYGIGIGTAGAATNSSFNQYSLRVVADNYYINLLIQFGALGIVFFALITLNYFASANRIGKSIIVGMLATSFFTELWEYSTFASLALIITVFDGLAKLNYFEEHESIS